MDNQLKHKIFREHLETYDMTKYGSMIERDKDPYEKFNVTSGMTLSQINDKLREDLIYG